MENTNNPTLCYSCKYRRPVSGDTHSACAYSFWGANVTADPHGISNGWFIYPWNFDPIWLRTCDGYETK
jgi:hypothetical protein